MSTQNTIIGIGLASIAFAGGVLVDNPEKVIEIVTVENHARVVDVISQLDITPADFSRLVPFKDSVDTVRNKSSESQSDLIRSFEDSILEGKGPTGDGILTVDEITALYAKTIEGKWTPEDALNNESMFDIIRR